MSLAFAIFICIPFGMGLGAAICSVTLAAVEHRHRQHILELQAQIEQMACNAPTPLEIGALGRLTQIAVLDGYCAICGSDQLGLVVSPYHPAYHRQNPCCPVPYARQLFLKRTTSCAAPTREPSSSFLTGVRSLLPSARH